MSTTTYTFNAEVNGYYAPKFEAATLADAIAYANDHFLGIVGAPRKFTDSTICMAVRGKWVPADMIEWSEIDADWARPLAAAQAAKRHATQAWFDAWTKRLVG